MIKRDDVYLNWWIDTSKMWIIRAHGEANQEGETMDFDSLLYFKLHEEDMDFRQIAKEWDISLEVLAELVADHIRRLE